MGPSIDARAGSAKAQPTKLSTAGLIGCHMAAKGGYARALADIDESLTQERVDVIAGPRRQLIMTFVNRVRLDFARTWTHHVMRLSLTNWLVGATDERALSGLRAMGVPRFSMRTNLDRKSVV